MAKSKNKKTQANSRRRRYSPAQKTILLIIFIAFFIVFIALLCAFFLKPEKIVKSKIDTIASDYYENYFYEKLITSEKYTESKDLDDILGRYKDNGLATLNLRQLLLYDNQKNAEFAPYLKKYCDEENTYIKFYPEPPYSRTSYHIDYTYSCNF